MIRVFFGVPESYGNSYWALMGHTGKERKASKGGRTPPHGLVRIGLGKGGAPFLLCRSPFPSPTPTRKGGVLLPVGVGLPPMARLSPWPAAPPCSFIYTGRGAPLNTQVDQVDRLLAVCAAPSTIVHLNNTVAVLRRSPASVEHQHRHHAVVLTKLSLNTQLDRSSRDVIGLNVC